jgi:protein phosphatase-4 regulatory subunit 3
MRVVKVQGKDPSLTITRETHEESDEDQLDTVDTSPLSDLPACELSKLKDIRDLFNELTRKSSSYKEKFTTILENDGYIKKLVDLFHMCEDLENTEGLHFLYEIFRNIFYLNRSSLFDILLSEDMIMDVIGCLEYDPSKAEQIRHREFINTKSHFKEIIPFNNVELVSKIHQTYRIQYIQDVILPAPSVFEENSLACLSSFVFLNKVEISNMIQVCLSINYYYYYY